MLDLAESPSAKKLQDLILVVEGGVEDFVLNQLVISIAVSSSPPAFPPATRLADQQPSLARAPCFKVLKIKVGKVSKFQSFKVSKVLHTAPPTCPSSSTCAPLHPGTSAHRLCLHPAYNQVIFNAITL